MTTRPTDVEVGATLQQLHHIATQDADAYRSFADLIAFAAQTRSLGAGTIVGGGTVSNKLDGGPGLPIAEGGVGYSCIAEQRAVEKIRHGSARTEFAPSRPDSFDRHFSPNLDLAWIRATRAS